MKAADSLNGLTLKNGWTVVSQLDRAEGLSGGLFSKGYMVEREGSTGFLKALDFSSAFESGVDQVDELQRLTASFMHERDILEYCKARKLSNVVLAIEHGTVAVPGFGTMEGSVSYLIFERAECDVREQVDRRNQIDVVRAARIAKDICLGLWQLNREMIAHQDTKPSNTLLYKNGDSKISDFGRSSRKGRPAAHDDYNVPGDRTYASPELIYGFVSSDFNVRRFGCDLYMLGNLICFLFSGINLTSAMFARLAPEHHFENWGGTYYEVLPYIMRAYNSAVEAMSHDIDATIRTEVLEIVKELTHPDIAKRGSKKAIGTHEQYSLERFVSRFNYLVSIAEIRSRTLKAAS
jgi:eukaryotic-like serine/threonine-protein kinase